MLALGRKKINEEVLLALFMGAFGPLWGGALFCMWVLVPIAACWLGWHLLRIILGLSRRLNEK